MTPMKPENNATLLLLQVRQELDSADNVSDVEKALSRVLPAVTETASSVSADMSEFRERHFIGFCHTVLVPQVAPKWLRSMDGDQKERLFNGFFLHGPASEAFISLCRAFKEVDDSYALTQLLSLLERYLRGEPLQHLLWLACQVRDEAAHDQHQVLWDEVIMLLTTVPDLVANRLHCHDRLFFYPDTFFPSIGSALMLHLGKIFEAMSASQDCSLVFLCRLVGKICLRGHTDALFRVLTPELSSRMQDNFLWRRLASQLITNVGERALEPLLDCLLRTAQPCLLQDGFLVWLFSDSLSSNRRIKYLFTHKFLCTRHYTQVSVLHNLFSCLRARKDSGVLLSQTFLKLLSTWSDSSALRHNPYEQHRYITRALLLAFSHLADEEIKSLRSKAMPMLLDGVQAHLLSPIDKVRLLGMVTAECLTRKLKTSGDQLTFEYKESDETRILVAVSKPLKEQWKWFKYEILNKESAQEANVAVDKAKSVLLTNLTTPSVGKDQCSPKVVELDSDDDEDEFTPYKMDDSDLAEERTDVGDCKPPVFLRECIAGLIAREKRQRTAVCLAAVERLIRANPPELIEVCAELIKVLLHLQDEYCLPGFAEQRMKAMVALAVFCAQQVAQYLTEQFYEVNYSLRHRIDMLEVLEAAAQELSSANRPSSSKKALIEPIAGSSLPSASDIVSGLTPRQSTSHLAISNAVTAAHEKPPEPEWKAVVRQRIELKTRRFVQGPLRPQPIATANRFSHVAGNFFYPLMGRFDSTMNTLDLLGKDFLVLGRLVFTLGSILHSAAMTQAASAMAGALLEFTWVLRQHREPFVRQAVVFAHCMVMSSVLPELLLSERQMELVDAHQWLQGVVESDPDGQCRQLAMNALPMLNQLFSPAHQALL